MNRQVHTIFCDDIRHEINGKVSYIGVYSGLMFVPQFPISLPKLCLALNVVTPVTDPFRKIVIRVLKDRETITEAIVSDAELTKYGESVSNTLESERKDQVHVFRSLLVFSPFNLEGPCVLRVRVETEESEMRGAGLIINLVPSESK